MSEQEPGSGEEDLGSTELDGNSGEQDAGPDEHADEVYVDTANLPEAQLIVESGSVDAYLQAIGIDPSMFSDEPPVV